MFKSIHAPAGLLRRKQALFHHVGHRIMVSVHRFRVQRSGGVRDKDKIEDPKSS
jgi:hypothetical protein